MPPLPGLLAEGVDLANLDTGRRLAGAAVEPVSANAYLGGWGIAEALAYGADVVVTGHIIECGPQACGGNYSFLAEVTDRRYPGFPIAEVAADGSSVITKHADTGGLVLVGTVTAQLLYEIDTPAYANPDVLADFGTVELRQQGSDRVLVSGTRGSAPSDFLKVAINYLGGYRNTMTLVLTGLDIQEKAAWATQELFDILGGRESFAETDVRLLRFDSPDAVTNVEATAHLRVTVKDPDRRKVGPPVLRCHDATGPGRLCRLSHHHPAVGRKCLRCLLAGAGPPGAGRAARGAARRRIPCRPALRACR